MIYLHGASFKMKAYPFYKIITQTPISLIKKNMNIFNPDIYYLSQSFI